MPTNNAYIAQVFNKIGDLLEIEGENRFRIRAYRNAAMTVENLSHNLSDMVKNGEDLTELPGIGKDLAQKITDIVKGKKIELLERLEKEFPPELSKLMTVPGLGPKKVKILYDALNIKSFEDLTKAAQEKKISKLPSFSEKIEEHILNEVKKIKTQYNRINIATADQYALGFVEYLKQDKNIINIQIAGSYRRRQETIGDIDILVTCDKIEGWVNGGKYSPQPSLKQNKSMWGVMERFVTYMEVAEILSKGQTRSSVILKSGIQVDIRVVSDKSYGAALHYFTGSKAHNIEIRKLAIKHGWKVNEYGLFDGEKLIAGKTEEEIYNKLGLTYIEPELRENRGELEAAAKGRLPELIELKDIKGDLHVHTNATDGHNSLEEMVEAAQERGYEYIANTEHSKHVTIARGLDEKALAEHIKRVDKLNSKLNNFTILKGIELDILEDGSLDLSDSILKELDLRVCAIHYKFNLTRQQQTDRILRAMDSPYFNIFAHPTCRLINQRDPIDIDMEKIMKKAKENNCVMELDAHPSRLDLNDVYLKAAKDMGIKIAISTDSHNVGGYDAIFYGIGQARRGWLEAKDAINTRSLSELKKLLKK